MSRGRRQTIVSRIAAALSEDVTTMLNQLHTAADLAADHRRTLEAEADAYRLARTAAPVSRARRRWLRPLRPFFAMYERHSRPTGSDECAARPTG
jgi:hypothetical protein